MVTITPMKFLKLRKMKNILPSRRCVKPTSAGDLDGCASDEIQTGRSSASKELTRLAFVCDKMIQYLPSKKIRIVEEVHLLLLGLTRLFA